MLCDYVGSVVIALRAVLTLDTLLGCVLTLCFFFIHYSSEPDGNGSWSGQAMDWTVLSMAVVFPISTAISIAFSRRDQALSEVTALLAQVKHLYTAIYTWRAKSTERGWVRSLTLVMRNGVARGCPPREAQAGT